MRQLGICHRAAQVLRRESTGWLGKARRSLLYNVRLAAGTAPYIPSSPAASSGLSGGTFTGATSNFTVASVPIPADTLGPNGRLRVGGLFICNNRAAAKIYYVNFGAYTIRQASFTTSVGGDFQVGMMNKGVTNSQTRLSTQ